MFINKIEKERKENPIYLTRFKLNIMSSTKYLGRTIYLRSAIDTVKSRAGKIKGAAMEFKTIIEDVEKAAIGGLAAAWELWERALLPSLLSGAPTWLGRRDNSHQCQV